MTFEHNGEIDCPIDLKTTIESGQTFLWNKYNGNMFDEGTTKSNPIYYTSRITEDDEIIVIKVKSDNNRLVWESTHSTGEEYVKSIFQLDKDIKKIQSELIHNDTNGVIEKSITKFPGLRIVNEPLYPTLISFICSTQMRVKRINNMVSNISNTFGRHIDVGNRTYATFPKPNELSVATETQLKDIKLGYRASYVLKTNDMIMDSNIELSKEVNEARKQLEEYVGVGPKVADCVLLYGAGFSSVVPVDVWIERAAKQYYPNCVGENKRETARNLEEVFGDYAGFAQAYLFHYMRTENKL